MKSGAYTTVDNLAKVAAGIELLASTRVMVGIPSEKTERREEGSEEPINNAEIGYLMENGSPEANIPARKHFLPAMRGKQKETADGLRKAAELAMDGRPKAVAQQLARVGSINASAVKAYINAGVNPPLAPATLDARRRRGVKRTKPLIDTAQYRNAITYVIRKIKGLR